MRAKIVNISAEVHALLKSHCSRNGLKIGNFVENLIVEAIPKEKSKTKKR